MAKAGVGAMLSPFGLAHANVADAADEWAPPQGPLAVDYTRSSLTAGGTVVLSSNFEMRSIPAGAAAEPGAFFFLRYPD